MYHITYISIHALLAESDRQAFCDIAPHIYFYPRSPCGERRTNVELHDWPPVISIHALLAESDWAVNIQRPTAKISIHALLAESDRKPSIQVQHPLNFYPRSPCGERPSNRTERPRQHDFYPRSPCGERPETAKTSNADTIFLSTLSLRRATPAEHHANSQQEKFLSTLSLRRATHIVARAGNNTIYFYPRSPCGERPWARGSRVTYVEISIHALLAESDSLKGS